MGQCAGFKQIWSQRDFDRFGRMRPKKLNRKQKMLEKMKQNLAANAQQDDEPSGPLMESKNQLRTDKFKIGTKKPVHGPVGAAAQPGKILNSEGFESFYSYDGYWRDGKMHGPGQYRFADGFSYDGIWKAGRQNGHGVATYDTGHKYEGHWKDGFYHGHGKLTYSTGVTYEGGWKQGKRHGRGTLTHPSKFTFTGDWVMNKMHGHGELTSELTGLAFHGQWQKGYINGNGSLIIDPRTAIARPWRTAGGMTFNELVTYLHDERMKTRQEQIDDYLHFHGMRVKIQTQNHVDEVREELYAQRQEAREALAADQRAKAAEQRKKQKEALLSSLLGKMDDVNGQQ